MTEFRVEIRDRSFALLEVLENEIDSIQFDYARIGGCGNFSFTLPRRYCDEKYISGDFNIRIYLRNSSTRNYDLWYQGIVQEKVPKVQGAQETVQVTGTGYVDQLTNIQISHTYAGMELSAIVKDILDNYIVGVKDIAYDIAQLENTGFTAGTLTFNTDVQSAIKTIADIAGTREWGVDKDRNFFFKARSSTVGFNFVLGKNILGFQEDQSFKEIVNHIVVQGGDIAGTPYIKAYDYANSQLKFGRRDMVYQNSSVTTDDVSAQLAASIFADYKDVIRKATCRLIGDTGRIEAVLPIPLFALKTFPADTYGTKLYGTGLYSGIVPRQINRIQYQINPDRELQTSLDMDFYRPATAEQLKKLEYKLEQIRNSNL